MPVTVVGAEAHQVAAVGAEAHQVAVVGAKAYQVAVVGAKAQHVIVVGAEARQVVDVGDCGYICMQQVPHDLHATHGGQILPTAQRCPHDIITPSIMYSGWHVQLH